jgi:hypothetical protein
VVGQGTAFSAEQCIPQQIYTQPGAINARI